VLTVRRIDGYIVDTPYAELLSVDLCPARLSTAAVLHGQPPLDHARPLTWIDLGCGNGLAACTVAAGNPNVEVWGCDFNPSHVERARHFATKAGLANCIIEEASFEEVASNARLGPEQADVVAVHGVYSWVSPANQRHIAEIIRKRLRPGGLAYVSYELQTGWSSMVPLTEAMRLEVDADGRRSDVAFSVAADAVQRLADGGSRCFPLGGFETSRLASFPDANGFYAAHEYLGSHFRPLMFDDVVDTLAAAHCTYVGSMDTTDHLSEMWVPPELRDLVTDTPDPTLQRMVRDLTTQRPLRRDLFRRGLALPTPPQVAEWLHDLTVVGLGKRYVDGAVAPVPVGEVALDESFYGPLVDHLAVAPLSVSELRVMRPELSLVDAVTTVSLLVSGSYAAPRGPGWNDSSTRAAVRRMNEALIAENRRGADHRCLVGRVTGAAIETEYVEMLAVGAIWDGEPAEAASLSTYVLAELERQGRAILENGVAVEESSEARAIVEHRVTDALARINGTLAHLGID
jgi:Predicted methyltransferase regulatory domain/Methyltransferase domain